MDTNSDCVFCKIVSGEIPAHIVWEGSNHLAFLSIFPNTKGFTVVVAKDHLNSDVFALPEEQYHSILNAAFEVAQMLKLALTDVGRVALVAEGTGVDHAHVKLIPLHGTIDESWREKAQKITTFYETYPGYVSTHDSMKADDEKLAELAELIRKVNTPQVVVMTTLPPDDGISEHSDPMSDNSE